MSCRILISFRAICEKMTGIDLVIAENMSVEDSLKIAVWGTEVMPANMTKWRITRMRSTQFYCSGQPFPLPPFCLLLNLRVKNMYTTFRITADSYILWFSTHQNDNVYIQNSERNILNINRLWSSIMGGLKLLFEIIYIFELFYSENPFLF